MVRKSLAVILAVALFWVSVASGLLGTVNAGSNLQHHAALPQHGAALSHHAHGAAVDVAVEQDGIPSNHAHKSQRECAAACLETVDAKLFPPLTLVKAPQGKFVFAPLATDPATTASIAEVRLGYWPIGPPSEGRNGRTGGARVLANHAFLRI